MKKYVSAFYVCLVMVLSVAITSCSKDNEPDVVDNLPTITMTEEQNFEQVLDVCIKVGNCTSAYYTVNDGGNVTFSDSVAVRIEDTSTITVVATNAYGQKIMKSTYTKAKLKNTEYVIVLNEGNFQSDNGSISYYDCVNKTWTNNWFRAVNNKKIGDTPESIVKVGDNLIAISVNWSGFVQFIDKSGKDCGAVEVPNCRHICADGKGYMYITSYAHELGDKRFTKGFVAKIDLNSKTVVSSCEVGWEPEGIVYYDGKLIVANTGGYSFSESHDYDTTISVINADNMTVTNTIDTGKINLYGGFSQIGKYFVVNSMGNYADVSASTILFDCEKESVIKTFDFGCAYVINDGTNFYIADYSYATGEYTFNTIDPNTATVKSGFINDAIAEKIKSLTVLYSLYYSKETGYIYFTDANDYCTSGSLYAYSRTGKVIFDGQQVHINPGHLVTYTE